MSQASEDNLDVEALERPAGGTPVVVVRYSGTLGTKASAVRSRFAQKLRSNLQQALEARDIAAELRRDWNRLYVEPRESTTLTDIATPLRRVMGVQSLRPSFRMPWDDLDDIVEAARTMWRDRLDRDDLRTFAVRAQRVGDRQEFDFDSPQAGREIGATLDIDGVSVDLEAPDIEVGVDIHADRAYLYGADIAGPGGLPIGTQGKALALISGGFDSAVAARRMYRRGVDLDYLYFQLTGAAHRRAMRRVLAKLTRDWGNGTSPSLTIVDFRPVVADIRQTLPERHWQLALKRCMYRASAARLDETSGEPVALVTGEAIGQVSTQTLTNLCAIEAGIETPVVRPLVTENKEAIVDEARAIGIEAVASEVPESCALQSGRQVTEAPAGHLDELVDQLDDDIRRAVVDRADVENARALPDRSDAQIQVETVPDEAVPVDLRSEDAYEQWHPPDALHVPFDVAVEQGAALPSEPTYLFYCDVGLKSAHVAERLSKLGFNAYSFDGSINDLKISLAGSS